MKDFHHVYTQRDLKHLDLTHEIYDEDYLKITKFVFGLIKITRKFKLRNDMANIKPTEVGGFSKKK